KKRHEEAKKRQEDAERRFLSQFPPVCEASNSDARYFMIVTLAGSDQIVADVQYQLRSHARGVLRMSLTDFGRVFSDVVQYSRANNCRFRVQINDTDRVSKAEFKRAVGAIKERFYIVGETR